MSSQLHNYWNIHPFSSKISVRNVQRSVEFVEFPYDNDFMALRL